ncbi:MAG: DNA repair protein RadC [Pseudomonadota bacterium]
MTLPERGATLAQGFRAHGGSGPARQRAVAPGEPPRERLLERGVGALTDAELLSLCLRTGTFGVDALTLAEGLLAGFGGLNGLSRTPVARLLGVSGLGPAKVAALLATLELGRRAASFTLPPGQVLASTAAALAYVRGEIGGAERERFACLFLDSRHRPLGFEVLFEGSIDRACVHPREIVKRVLTYNAAAVILAHNHPSGDCEPSAADLRLTRELKAVLRPIDVRLLDHLVVARGAGVSLAERGLLAGD